MEHRTLDDWGEVMGLESCLTGVLFDVSCTMFEIERTMGEKWQRLSKEQGAQLLLSSVGWR